MADAENTGWREVSWSYTQVCPFMVLTMTIVISLTLGFLSVTCRIPITITTTTGKALYVISLEMDENRKVTVL